MWFGGGSNTSAPDGQTSAPTTNTTTTTATTTNVTTSSTNITTSQPRSSQPYILNNEMLSGQPEPGKAAQTSPSTTTTATGKILQLPQQQQQPATAASSSSSSSSGGVVVGSISSSGGDRPEKISFHLKSGIFTRRITIDTDKMALGLIKQLAIAFLNEIYFQHTYPANTYIGDYIKKHYNNNDDLNLLYERILLRIYNSEEGTFQPFNTVADITQETFVSIEITEKHLLSSSNAHSTNSMQPSASVHSPGVCTTPSSYQLKISHDFHPETYYFMTHCASCSLLIRGVFKQGFQCTYCKKNYCPKCKVRAEATSEGCLALAPATSVSSGTGGVSPSMTTTTSTSTNTGGGGGGLLSPQLGPNQNQILIQSGGDNNNNNNIDSQSAKATGGSTNNGDQTNNGQCNSNNPTVNSNKSDHMSKRKSASNLLHFNIANPFKSHHSQQSSHANQGQLQHQTSKDEKVATKSIRGSAGALDPVLQQLSKQMRDQHIQQQQQQQKAQQRTNNEEDNNNSINQQNTNLLGVHAAQLSSSHQNLYTIKSRDSTSGRSGGETGSSSVHQSPSKGAISQLSNSARASTRDLLHATSPTRRDQATSHTFISMDWIQIGGDPNCGVCNKSLKPHQPQVTSQNQQQQSPAMCKVCKLQVHAQCQTLAPTDCLNRITESSRAAAGRNESNNQQGENGGTGGGAIEDRAGVKGTSSNVSRDNIRLHRLAPSVKHVKRPDATKPILEGWLQHKTLSDEQSRKHYWRLDDTDITLYENDTSTRYFKAIALSKITRVISASALPKRIKEDVLLSDLSKQQAEGGGGDSFRGQAKSANNSPAKSSEFRDQMNAMFGFEVATGSVYLVQARDSAEASRWKGSLEAIRTKVASSYNVTKDKADKLADEKKHEQARGHQQQHQDNETVLKAKQAEHEIVTPTEAHQQQQPPLTTTPTTATTTTTTITASTTSTSTSTTTAVANTTAAQTIIDRHKQSGQQQPPQRHHHHHHPASNYRGQHKTYTDPSRSRLYNRPRIVIKLDPMSIPDHWIEGKYLIERDRVKGVGFEELGSGQFGKVYAAISEIKAEDHTKGLWSGVPVAIKEISKARFDLRQQAKLKNEANILSRLDHPGVIILERVHDLHDKIYIVMEQLEDDMLEMIVSTPEKRLNERITKFLTYQILEALKYLHAQNIAHCDLKPENVLLVERRSQFPQIKLCDFGFAKIIEENSFRSSLVGTPAYLAPEVVKGERYNRSVDLWSVGVIVYVSLSGEFPFNEGENIHDQISRANFMYPDQPWAKISSQAKNFINSLLRVNSDKRLSANRAQMDDWIQDYQLWCDLCELEVRIGKRWVTDDADFERWSRYARERSLQVPRSAVLLHEQMLGD